MKLEVSLLPLSSYFTGQVCKTVNKFVQEINIDIISCGMIEI